jgi:Ni,Fe-hydrogenase I cytochrome b subunit
MAAIHSLGSWLFVAFVIMHVYLTTTGHTPSTHIRAMVTGWEEIEANSAKKERGRAE